MKGCDVQVLSHEEERFHLQVTCAQCQVTFIVVLAIAGGAFEEIDETKVGLDAELAAEPAASELIGAAAAPEPISLDEILDLHLYLKSFQGTLKELIQQPDASRG